MNTTAGIARGSKATFSPAITSTATRPSCDALCASIGSPTTSPIAKIDGSCGARLLVDDDEAALDRLRRACVSSPGISEFGRRPTETSTRSKVRSLCSPLAFERDADAVRLRLHADDLRLQQHGLLIVSIALREDVDEIAIGARQQPGVISTTVTALPSAA